MQSVNFIAILGATIAAAFAGGLWYSPLLFTKVWMREGKLDEAIIKQRHPLLLLGGSFVLNFVAAFALAIGLGHDFGLVPGIEAGLMVSVLWVAGSVAMNHLFEGRSLKFFCVTAGYHVVRFTLMGVILGLWN